MFFENSFHSGLKQTKQRRVTRVDDHILVDYFVMICAASLVSPFSFFRKQTLDAKQTNSETE